MDFEPNIAPRADEPGELTLATVRELSERATLRPAPRILRCIPLRVFSLNAVSVLKQRLDRKAQILVLLDQLSNLNLADRLRGPGISPNPRTQTPSPI